MTPVSHTVKLPKDCRIIDCRTPDGGEVNRDHNGKWLMASEYAVFLLGYPCCNPRGSGGDDLRNIAESCMSNQIDNAIRAWKDVRRQYCAARRNPSRDGGSVHYRPVCIAVSNYGWSILADQRDSYTQGFRNNSVAV